MIKPIPEAQAKYNAKVKYYPNQVKITCFSKKIYNPHKLEEIKKTEDVKIIKPKNTTKKRDRKDSIKRAKDRAYDICFANKFDYFVTFTLDSKKIDRYDKEEVLKKLNKWLNNRVQRNDLKYIIFPEYHKDGAIHFHGLCSGDIKLKDSGKVTKNNQKIYNAGAWTLGYSTVVILDSQKDRIINYVIKYITKENERVFNRYYLSGGKDLKREVETEYTNLNFLKFNGKFYKVPNTDLGVKYKIYSTNDKPNVSRETNKKERGYLKCYQDN